LFVKKNDDRLAIIGSSGALAPSSSPGNPAAGPRTRRKTKIGRNELTEQQTPSTQLWTERELELLDGMIEVQLHHAEQCDGIANRTMADKQKGWDMERVALLQKIKGSLMPEQKLAVEPMLQKQLDDALRSLDFYKRRCDALQNWQSKMRDPERTIVCDILANGCTLEPAGDRYTPPDAKPVPMQDPRDGELVRRHFEADLTAYYPNADLDWDTALETYKNGQTRAAWHGWRCCNRNTPPAQPAPVQEPHITAREYNQKPFDKATIPTEVGIAWQAGAWPAERRAVMVDGRRWYRDDHEKVQPQPPAQPAVPAREHEHALEQALTRLQKRYAELEAKVGAQPEPVQELQRYSPDGEGGMEVDSLGAYVKLQDVSTPKAQRLLDGVIEVKPVGYHSLQLIFDSQESISNFIVTHGITVAQTQGTTQ